MQPQSNNSNLEIGSNNSLFSENEEEMNDPFGGEDYVPAQEQIVVNSQDQQQSVNGEDETETSAVLNDDSAVETPDDEADGVEEEDLDEDEDDVDEDEDDVDVTEEDTADDDSEEDAPKMSDL